MNKENEKLKSLLQKTREKYEKYSQETEKAQKALEAAKAIDKPPNELLKVKKFLHLIHNKFNLIRF